MAGNTGFSKTHYDQPHGWMMNNIPFKSSGGTEVEIKNKKYIITHAIQNVITNKTYNTAKSMNDNEK